MHTSEKTIFRVLKIDAQTTTSNLAIIQTKGIYFREELTQKKLPYGNLFSFSSKTCVIFESGIPGRHWQLSKPFLGFLKTHFQFHQHHHQLLEDVQIRVYEPLSHIFAILQGNPPESPQTVLEINTISYSMFKQPSQTLIVSVSGSFCFSLLYQNHFEDILI